MKERLSYLVFFLLIVFLPTQLGKHFWPEFTQIYSIRIDYLSPVVYFWDFLAIGFFILRIRHIKKATITPLLIFILSCALSLIFSDNIGAGLVRIEQYLIAGLFGLSLSTLDFKRLRYWLLSGVYIGLVIESFLAIAQVITERSIGLWILGERNFDLTTPSIANFNWFGELLLRPYATFPHPNVLAAYLVMVMPLIYFLEDKRRLIKHTLLVLGAVVVLLSFSRAAILVLIFESFYFFRSKLRWLVIVGLLLLPILSVRLHSAISFDALSLSRREELAGIAWGIFINNPIFGTGLNSFINEVSKVGVIQGPNRFLQPVHNIFLLVLAETGMLGFIGFLYLIYSGLKKLFLKAILFQKVLVCIWVIMLILGMLDHYFMTLPQGQRLFFLIWGLSMLEYNGVKDS